MKEEIQELHLEWLIIPMLIGFVMLFSIWN